VGSNDQPRRPPEGAFRRRRLLRGHIEGRRIEPAAREGDGEGMVIHERPPGHVHENRPGLHPGEGRRVDHPAGLLGERGTEKQDIGRREHLRQRLGRPEELDSRGAADGKPVGRQDPDAEGLEHRREPAAHAAEPHDPDRRAGQVAGGPTDKLPPGLLLEKQRQPPGAGDRQAEGVLGHLIGEHSGGAGDDDRRVDDARHEAVVEPGGRRLDPPQATGGDDLVPGHRHLGVAAVDVGCGEFLGHPLLAGIDEGRAGGGSPDLGDVVGLDGIAEDDPHDPMVVAGNAAPRQAPRREPAGPAHRKPSSTRPENRHPPDRGLHAEPPRTCLGRTARFN